MASRQEMAPHGVELQVVVVAAPVAQADAMRSRDGGALVAENEVVAAPVAQAEVMGSKGGGALVGQAEVVAGLVAQADVVAALHVVEGLASRQEASTR